MSKNRRKREGRKKKQRLENFPLPEKHIEEIARTLTKQINKEIFEEKYAPIAEILKLVGTGAFLAASFAVPNLPRALKPFLYNKEEYYAWKRFNIPYLKRTLERLKGQKLVVVKEKEGVQTVEITDAGRRRILRYALDELAVEKPRFWDGRWRLVSYDIPIKLSHQRRIFTEYLKAWGFYPLHQSVYLHAYPCEKQVEFLREYLRIGEFIRIFKLSQIENDRIFRVFFGI